MADSPEDVIADMRLHHGRTFAPLVPFLNLSSPALAAWFAAQSIAETANDRHARALLDVRLMKGIAPAVKVATITARHYGGNYNTLIPAELVSGNFPAGVRAKTEALKSWLESDPDLLAKYLATLPLFDSG